MHPITRLLDIMVTLRDPNRGCAWDKEQTFATIAPFTVEEAYEVADAIDMNDLDALKEELGDLLFQVVFHSRMAEEQHAFAFADVVNAITEKMIRRHPHVFGDGDRQTSADGVVSVWEANKDKERAAKGHASVLDGVARALPPMTRALKLQNRAARVGFDWPDAAQVLVKVKEEIGEVEREMEQSASKDRIEDEMGDILFACVNLARKLNIDPEQALKRTNEKFDRRFRHVEAGLRIQSRRPQDASLDEMESLWVEAKRTEPGKGADK